MLHVFGQATFYLHTHPIFSLFRWKLFVGEEYIKACVCVCFTSLSNSSATHHEQKHIAGPFVSAGDPARHGLIWDDSWTADTGKEDNFTKPVSRFSLIITETIKMKWNKKMWCLNIEYLLLFSQTEEITSVHNTKVKSPNVKHLKKCRVTQAGCRRHHSVRQISV